MEKYGIFHRQGLSKTTLYLFIFFSFDVEQEGLSESRGTSLKSATDQRVSLSKVTFLPSLSFGPSQWTIPVEYFVTISPQGDDNR